MAIKANQKTSEFTYLRDGTYYFRYTFPKEIQSISGRQTIRFSLQTSSFRMSRSTAKHLKKSADSLLNAIREGMIDMTALSWDMIPELVRQHLLEEFDKLKINRAHRQSLKAVKKDYEERLSEYLEEGRNYAARRTFQRYSKVQDPSQEDEKKAHQTIADRMTEMKKSEDYSPMHVATMRFLAKRDIQTQKTTKEFHQLVERLTMNYATLHKAMIQLIQCKTIPEENAVMAPIYESLGIAPSQIQTPRAVVPQQMQNQPTTQPFVQLDDSNNKMLSQLIEEYVVEMSNTIGLKKGWSPHTAQDEQTKLKDFLFLVGDRPIKELTAADLRKAKKDIQCLPSNRLGRPAYKNKSLDELRAMTIPDKHKFSPQTVYQRGARVGNFLRWVEEQQYAINTGLDNIFKFPKGDTGESSHARFTKEDLQIIFAPATYHAYAIWSGSRSARMVTRIKESHRRCATGARYWIPLIALLTGMRLEEISQLETQDIKAWINEDDSINFHYIDINDRLDKSVKTKTGKRHVPIHQTLVDLGLLNYRARQEQEQSNQEIKWLFPELKKDSDTSKRGTVIGRAFAWYIRHLEKEYPQVRRDAESEETKVFHSFRNTFIDVCYQLGLDRDLCNTLDGHADSSMRRRYADRLGIERIYREVIAKLDIQRDFGLDLMLLKRDEQVLSQEPENYLFLKPRKQSSPAKPKGRPKGSKDKTPRKRKDQTETPPKTTQKKTSKK